MSLSVSASTPFNAINWDNFENRPPINGSMTFCEEKDWYEDQAKCCMDYYSIEHVLDVAHEYELGEAPEVKFLEQYPCLNGLELDYFVDEIESMPSNVHNEKPEAPPTFTCVTQLVFDSLKGILPNPILDSIKPYLCGQ